MEVHEVFEDSLGVDILRTTWPLFTVNDLIAFVDQSLTHAKESITRQILLPIEYWVRFVRKACKFEHLHSVSCNTVTRETVSIWFG